MIVMQICVCNVVLLASLHAVLLFYVVLVPAIPGPGEVTQVNHVVIQEKKMQERLLSHLHGPQDRVYGINFMKSWKKGYSFQQSHIVI